MNDSHTFPENTFPDHYSMRSRSSSVDSYMPKGPLTSRVPKTLGKKSTRSLHDLNASTCKTLGHILAIPGDLLIQCCAGIGVLGSLSGLVIDSSLQSCHILNKSSPLCESQPQGASIGAAYTIDRQGKKHNIFPDPDHKTFAGGYPCTTMSIAFLAIVTSPIRAVGYGLSILGHALIQSGAEQEQKIQTFTQQNPESTTKSYSLEEYKTLRKPTQDTDNNSLVFTIDQNLGVTSIAYEEGQIIETYIPGITQVLVKASFKEELQYFSSESYETLNTPPAHTPPPPPPPQEPSSHLNYDLHLLTYLTKEANDPIAQMIQNLSTYFTP